jgi:hypothetical protein
MRVGLTLSIAIYDLVISLSRCSRNLLYEMSKFGTDLVFNEAPAEYKDGNALVEKFVIVVILLYSFNF